MNGAILRKYGELLTTAKAITFSLFEVDGIDLRVDATFATGDVTISKDGGAETNTTNLPVDEGKGYSLILTLAELQCSQARVSIVDQTGTKVWLDTELLVETYGNASAMHAFDLDTALVTLAAVTHTGAVIPVVTTLTNKTGFSLAATGLDAISSTALGMVEAAKAVWDRVLTGATHNINNSAGKRLRQASAIIFTDGTAQSGGNNSIQLASGDVTINDQFRRSRIIIIGGTGAGQEAIVTSSVASTDTLTITPTWLVNPDSSSEYEILPGQTHSTVRNGGYDNGFVYFDSVNGSSGQEIGVNGTSTNPSDNAADAFAIGLNESITKFMIEPGSTLTLPADSTGRRFEGEQYSVDLNGADIDSSSFSGAASVSGIATAGSGNPPTFILCAMGNVTLPPSNGFQCGFFGTLTMGSEGFYTWGGSASLGGSLIIDYGSGLNASTFFMQSWGGGDIEIQNAGAGTGTYSFCLNAIGGGLTINANCSADTNVDYFGPVDFTNNASGITVDDHSNAKNTDLVIVDSNVDDIKTAVETDIPADIAALPTAAEINAEVVDVMETDTHAEPSGVVGATASIKDAIMYVKTKLRNKMTQTSTTTLLRNDADTGTIATSTVSDDSTTFIKGKDT